MLKPGGLAVIQIALFPSLQGGHHAEWHSIDAGLPRRIRPWDHLCADHAPCPVYLNEWREAQYREVFDLRLSVLRWEDGEIRGFENICRHRAYPVVTEPGKAIRALKWTVEQMEERYRMMANLGVRALPSFNAKVRDSRAKGSTLGRRVQTGYDASSGQPLYEVEELEYEVLPQIVVVVDELADLMMTAGKEVEFLIQRLAQKARAAGIHLIMATQRPSVDVITGLIKANIPARVAFQVSARVDSRTILDQMGAEQLLGQGDMLFLTPGTGLPLRIHGAFVSDGEVNKVVSFLKKSGKPSYDDSILTGEAEISNGGGSAGLVGLDGEAGEGENDPLYDEALKIVTETRRASISGVQRRLRIGYNRAARLIEEMEKSGVVGPMQSNGNREVLAPPPPPRD